MTFENHKGATAPTAAVERRLYQYPGATNRVYRFFIVGDHTPKAYLTEREAISEILRRLAERRRP
jgi:hypothetical protein